MKSRGFSFLTKNRAAIYKKDKADKQKRTFCVSLHALNEKDNNFNNINTK